MGNRYVRMYSGPENSNIIGFSASAVPDRPKSFERFMSAQGYAVERFIPGSDRYQQIIANLGGVSFSYFGITPPLKEEDEPKLAEWCEKNVDTSHNSGFLIDNRETPMPLEPFHYRDQRLVAEF